MFGTDQVLLYNVEPWSKLGFGVPNFGDNLHTVNMQAHRLADEIGQLQLYIMTHVDVLRTRPPSRNTIERLGRLMNRVRNVLAGRAKEYSELRVEPGHGSPAPKPWTIHPVPYFNGPIVRNGWLAEYNEYCMLALTNLYQHTDNTLCLLCKFTASSDPLSDALDNNAHAPALIAGGTFCPVAHPVAVQIKHDKQHVARQSH